MNKNARPTFSAGLKRLLPVLFVAVTMAISHVANAQNKAPLRLGLIPHLSSNLLIRKYQNLINYLERSLDRPVIVSTAPDFKTYLKRARTGRFDLYLTAPHMGILLEKNQHHIVLVRFSAPLEAVIAVRKNSPYQSVKELTGKTLAAPNKLAMVDLMGEKLLTDAGLDIQSSVNLNYSNSSNNPLILLGDGKADAAISGFPGFRFVSRSPRLKSPLRILRKSSSVPHMFFLTPPHIPAAQRENIKSALLAIDQDATGRSFLEQLPFGKLIEVSEEDREQLKDFAKLLEQRLADD